MLKQIASLTLIVTMLCTFYGTTAFAQTLPDSSSTEKHEAQTETSLKAEMAKLIANAKADKALSVSDRQIQPKQSNSLSKGTKIAIVVGAALVVVLIIVVVHAKNHLFDDFRLGN